MKLISKVMIALSILAVSEIALADVYRIFVKRIDQDIYRTSDGIYIRTQYCYHYSYGEEAILKYDPYSYGNKIIFENDESCDVKGIFK